MSEIEKYAASKLEEVILILINMACNVEDEKLSARYWKASFLAKEVLDKLKGLTDEDSSST